MFNVTAEHSVSTSHCDKEQHRRCQNCGVTGMTNGGICARCLELPYCRRCKRHLPQSCFGDEPNLCLVGSQFQLYIIIVAFTVVVQLTIIAHNLLPVCFQTCARECAKRQLRVERAVGNIIAEVNIPPTAVDTTFGQFLQRNEDSIVDVIQEHVDRYGYAKHFYHHLTICYVMHKCGKRHSKEALH